MNKQADPIDAAIKVLKREGERRKKKADWEMVERDLGGCFAELALANNPVVHGMKGKGRHTNRFVVHRMVGKEYRRVGVPDASITEARELLGEAKKAFRAAKSLPTLLSFAERTYGYAGLTLIPSQAVKTYADALAELEPCIDTFENMLKETISKAGKTQGMKGPLLERIVGTPLQHFLQHLIRLWREATGSKNLGSEFELIARQLIEAALPADAAGNRPEIGDLKRQIESAKRRGEVVQTPWTHKAAVMEELLKRRNVRRRPR